MASLTQWSQTHSVSLNELLELVMDRGGQLHFFELHGISNEPIIMFTHP